MPSPTPVPEVDRWHFQTWLRVSASAKPEIYRQVFATAEVASLKYWLESFSLPESLRSAWWKTVQP
jgi:hypothetical protein